MRRLGPALTTAPGADDVPASFLRAGREAMLSAQSGGAKVMPKNPLTGVANEVRQARANKRVADLIRDGIARLEPASWSLQLSTQAKSTRNTRPS